MTTGRLTHRRFALLAAVAAVLGIVLLHPSAASASAHSGMAGPHLSHFATHRHGEYGDRHHGNRYRYRDNGYREYNRHANGEHGNGHHGRAYGHRAASTARAHGKAHGRGSAHSRGQGHQYGEARAAVRYELRRHDVHRAAVTSGHAAHHSDRHRHASTRPERAAHRHHGPRPDRPAHQDRPATETAVQISHIMPVAAMQPTSPVAAGGTAAAPTGTEPVRQVPHLARQAPTRPVSPRASRSIATHPDAATAPLSAAKPAAVRLFTVPILVALVLGTLMMLYGAGGIIPRRSRR